MPDLDRDTNALTYWLRLEGHAEPLFDEETAVKIHDLLRCLMDRHPSIPMPSHVAEVVNRYIRALILVSRVNYEQVVAQINERPRS